VVGAAVEHGGVTGKLMSHEVTRTHSTREAGIPDRGVVLGRVSAIEVSCFRQPWRFVVRAHPQRRLTLGSKEQPASCRQNRLFTPAYELAPTRRLPEIGPM
jgi:nitroreductase